MVNRISVVLRAGLALLAIGLVYWPIIARSMCQLTGSRPSQEELGYFALNPGGALTRAQSDPDKLKTIVARYVEADPGLLPKVKTLAKLVPSRYRVAIGAGLGIAQQTCSGSDPQVARTIQTFIGGVQDELLSSGYDSTFENKSNSSSVLNPVPVPQPSLDDRLRLADPFKPMPIPEP